MNYPKNKERDLLSAARGSIVSSFSGQEYVPPSDVIKSFSWNAGAFVTLSIDGILRGCIGYVAPIYPLFETVVKAAKHAAFEDPRFPPLDKDELSRIKIEITILMPPELVSAGDENKDQKTILSRIEVGKHGLIISNGSRSGLLLPQVASEWGWDAIEFIENTCMKAGLPINAWLQARTKIERFEGIIISE